MSQFSLFVDRQSRRLDQAIVRDATNVRPVSFPELVIGSSREFRLTILDGTNGVDAISGSATVQPIVSIGDTCAEPTGGTWTFTRGANTTAALAYNISAAALETAIEGLASVGSGNVSVKALPGNAYRIEYISTLADTAITDASSDGALLTPTSTATLNRVTEGGSGSNEVQIIRLKQVPFVLQASWTSDGTGWTAVLSTGSWEALTELAASAPITATLQVTIILADGTTEKLALQSAKILCDVSDPSQFVPAQFPTYLTAAQVNAKFSTGNVVWVSKSGNDGLGAVDRFDLPFLTVTAAQTASSSGDTILVLPGDYSAETALAGKDGVTYQGLDGAILPAFNVTTAITVKGSGLCKSLTCDNASAVMDMPSMDTVLNISCENGTQTAGNAGTLIFCSGGTQTAGNAGTYIFCSGGTQTAGNAGTFIQCSDGTQTAGNAGTYIYCDGSLGSPIQTAGNAGTFIRCVGGTSTIRLTDQSHDGTTFAPVYLSSSGSLSLYGDTSTSTESGGTVVNIANSWSGSLFIDGLKLKATTVATNEATVGITYGTGVTGTVNIKDLTIITAQDGTGTAKAIDAPSAQTVYIQGTLNTTHAVDADITLAGGSISTNTNYA